jgi:hypothetical protein
MKTHFRLLVTIGNLVSPSSCPSPETRAAADWRAPERKDYPFWAAWEIQADKPRSLLSRSYRLRDSTGR